MRDPRTDRMARILVRYSTDLQKGDKVLIHGPELAQPLALAVYREALSAGALPVLWSTFDEAARVLFDEASDEQLAWENPILTEAARSVDAYISLRAPTNLRMLSTVDPARSVLAQKARRAFLDVVLQKRWVLCEFPTAALAQEAGMSLREFEEFSFGAVLIDWPAMREELARRKARLEAGKEVRIVARGTDLRMGVGGRSWITDDGKHNMPGGEIFTGPIEDSVEGEITYEYPAVYNGREVEGVRMRFAGGRVVEASAARGEEFLFSMLDADEGARRLGELGIGTNYGIDRHTRSVLFDEKIGGTVHLAIGRSYDETGGTNVSAVHWDMVKDLRDGGRLHLDGKLIQRDGRWLD
ncbi:MAG TPA: aminopeptidase [Chloroflexota bacterium]|jgi:aminopeptidase